MDKISVIIPAFNAEKVITACLQSVCRSTYRDLEILVIDDGSTDRTAELIQAMQSEDDRIGYYKKDNGGVSSARNLGLERAAGSIVMFLDADDTYMPTYCEKVAALFSEANADAVLCGYNEEFNGQVRFHDCPVNKTLVSSEQIYEELVLKHYLSGSNAYLASVCIAGFRTELIRAWNLKFNSEIHHGEDRLFLLEYLLHCACLATINEPMYNYMLGDSSVTKKYNPSLEENNKTSGKRLVEVLRNSGHEITEDMQARSAVTGVFSVLVNEARAENPKPFMKQVKTAASANAGKKGLIKDYFPTSKVMRMKKIIAGNSGLCVCFYLTRRIQRAMGIYF